MTNLELSEKAGPEEVGFSSPANQVEAKKQPEACQRGRQPKSGSCTGRAPTGEFGGANYGTSRISPAPAGGKGADLRKATSNRPGHSAPRGGPQPGSNLDAGPRLESADIASKSRSLGALLPSGES